MSESWWLRYRHQEEKKKCIDIAEPEKKDMVSTMPTGIPGEAKGYREHHIHRDPQGTQRVQRIPHPQGSPGRPHTGAEGKGKQSCPEKAEGTIFKVILGLGCGSCVRVLA